jgi:TP901 family phage tail tape measure protein
MSSANAKLILEVAVEKEQALKALAATGGGLQTLTQQAQAAQAKLGAIDAFKALKADTVAAKTAWEEATAKVKALAKEIGATDAPSKVLVAELEQSKRAAASAKDAYQAAEQTLARLRATMAAVGVGTRDLVGEQKQLTAALARTKAEAESAARLDTARGLLDVRPHKEIRAEIERLRQAYVLLKESGTASVKELYQAQMRLQEKTKDLEHATNGWTDSLGKAQAGLYAMAGIGYAAMRGFVAYGDFSQRMGEISTLIDGNAASLKDVKQELVDISLRVPQGADTLAAAEYDILSAGVALENSTRVLEQSAEAAVAGVTDTKTAVNIGLGVVNAYGLQISELGNVYDVLFQTVKLGVTTFPELSQYLGETLPTAKAAGVSYQDVGAAIAEMTKAGIRTPQAATALKGAINALAAPAGESKKVFDELGITWNGLIPTLEQIAQKNLSIDQMRLLIPDVEARTGVLALTQHLDGLRSSAAAMESAGGSTKAAYDKMKDTPNNQLQLFKNTVAAVSLQLSELVAVALLPTANALKELLQVVLEAPAPMQALIGVTAASVGGMLLWHMGLSNVAMGFRGLLLGLPPFTAAINATTLATTGAATAMTALKLSMGVLAAFTAGYSLGAWMYKEFESVRDVGTYLVYTMAEIWAEIKHQALGAAALVQDAWASIKAGKIITAATVAENKRYSDEIVFNAQFLREQLKDNEKKTTTDQAAQLKTRVAQAKAGAGEAAAAEIAGATMLESAKDKLRAEAWQKEQEAFDARAKLLESNLVRQVTALEAELHAEKITRQEFDRRKLEAESQFNQDVLALRSEAAAKSAEIYGKDSKAYAGAALEKTQAEASVSKSQIKLEDSLKTSTSLTQTLEQALRSMGSTGAAAGAMAASGVREVGDAAEAEKKDSAGRAAGRKALAEEVNNTWAAIDVISTFSKEKLTKWYQDNQKYLYGQSGDTFDNLLLQHARDVYRNRANELAAIDDAQTAEARKTQAAADSQANVVAQQQAVAAGQEASKTMTVLFKDPSGAAVKGTFDEPAGEKFVEMLRRSGAVTA